jgi:hypothetical protein
MALEQLPGMQLMLNKVTANFQSDSARIGISCDFARLQQFEPLPGRGLRR